MSTSLEKRIAALEQRMGAEPVTLTMPDGSERQIRGDSRHFQRLCALLDSDEENHSLNFELKWLRDCTAISGEAAEPFNLLRILVAGPNEGETDWPPPQ